MVIQELKLSEPALSKNSIQQRAYSMWHETWRETYSQLGHGPELHSDDFTRQDGLVAFFLENKCAALWCHRKVNLEANFDLADSWLAPWPKDLIAMLAARSPMVLIGSGFCIAKEFRRKEFQGVPLKDLLAASCAYYFERLSSLHLMLGAMRNLRGTNTAVYRYGVTKLRTIDVHSEPTDLVIFERGKVHQPSPLIAHILEGAWERSRKIEAA